MTDALGLAPTGEEWAITAMVVHRIAGGKIVEITPYYQPAREVGGDFYDFFNLEETVG
jgi:serine phosphatase RsbU (regulator of sigma subunit)